MLNSTKSNSSASIPSEPFYKELHSQSHNQEQQEPTGCDCNCHEFHKNSCHRHIDEPVPKQHGTPCQKYLSQLPPKPQSSQSCGKKAKVDSKPLKSLPTKRESIRMLYENKAVTENPLKSTLEHHFYNINTAKRVHHNHLNQQ